MNMDQAAEKLANDLTRAFQPIIDAIPPDAPIKCVTHCGQIAAGRFTVTFEFDDEDESLVCFEFAEGRPVSWTRIG